MQGKAVFENIIRSIRTAVTVLQVLKELSQAPGNTLTGLLWTERFGFISTLQSSQSRFACRLDFRRSLVSGNNSLVVDCKRIRKFCFRFFFQHHCRKCGGIFCNSCSDYTMPLPSSAKPVRVCDACYTTLLQRYQRWQQSAIHLVSGCLDSCVLRCGDFWRIVFGEEFHDIFSCRQDFQLCSTGEIYASLKFIGFFLTKHLRLILFPVFQRRSAQRGSWILGQLEIRFRNSGKNISDAKTPFSI